MSITVTDKRTFKKAVALIDGEVDAILEIVENNNDDRTAKIIKDLYNKTSDALSANETNKTKYPHITMSLNILNQCIPAQARIQILLRQIIDIYK